MVAIAARAAAASVTSSAIVAVLRRRLLALTERDGVDLIAAATSLSGAFWQTATPGPGGRRAVS